VRRTLIVDADDTLWENNVYFEAAIDRFLSLVVARGHGAQTTREHLMSVERRNVKRLGYGSSVFVLSLFETLEEVCGDGARDEERTLIEALGRGIQEMPIQFMPGVLETLPVLRESSRLILFTKGDPEEQRRKVERSGVSHHFHEVEVTTEKDRDAYLGLVDRHALSADRTWMVGNSPRSDINPALAAGLNAVLIPHPRTWELEHEDIQHEGLGPRSLGEGGPRLTVLERFADLLRLFS